MAEAIGDIAPAEFSASAYDVKWGTKIIGAVDEVKPDLTLVFQMLKSGTTGEAVLDEVFMGLADGPQVTITCKQAALERFRGVVPWANQTAAKQVLLTPPLGTRLYQYKQTLILHPRHKGAADLTEDIEIYATVPIASMPVRDGKKQDQWQLVFRVFADQTKVAAGEAPYARIRGDGT